MPTSALHVARTGLEAQDARMRVIANNLANVGTTGFKRDRANFATLAYQDARVAGQQSSGETAYATGLNLGTGVAVQSTSQIMTQGTLNTTGNALRSGARRRRLFQVEMPGGRLGLYPRGQFHPFRQKAAGHPARLSGAAGDHRSRKARPRSSVSPDGTVSATLAGRSRPIRARPDPGRELRQPGRASGDRRQLPVETGASGPAEMASPAVRTAAAISARACWKARTSTSSRNWST